MLTGIHRALRSERVKLHRPRLLAPLLLTSAALAAVLSTALVLLTDGHGTGDGGVLGPTRTAAPVVGLVLMCTAATAFCNEYREATWRNLLVRQPHRALLVLGKLAGLLELALLVALTVCVTGGAGALGAALVHGTNITDWTTARGIADAFATALRLAAALLACTVLGSATGLLLRSGGAAVGALLGWVLIVESALGALALSRGWDAGDWLPGSAVTRLATAPSWELPLFAASGWCLALLSAAVVRFGRTADR